MSNDLLCPSTSSELTMFTDVWFNRNRRVLLGLCAVASALISGMGVRFDISGDRSGDGYRAHQRSSLHRSWPGFVFAGLDVPQQQITTVSAVYSACCLLVGHAVFYRTGAFIGTGSITAGTSARFAPADYLICCTCPFSTFCREDEFRFIIPYWSFPSR